VQPDLRASRDGGPEFPSGVRVQHQAVGCSSNELISEMRAQAYLTASNTLSFYRDSANSSATFTAYVVQFKP
jgi:hypothetical protein